MFIALPTRRHEKRWAWFSSCSVLFFVFLCPLFFCDAQYHNILLQTLMKKGNEDKRVNNDDNDYQGETNTWLHVLEKAEIIQTDIHFMYCISSTQINYCTFY